MSSFAVPDSPNQRAVRAAGTIAMRRVIRRRIQGGSRISRKPSITIWPAIVAVTVFSAAGQFTLFTYFAVILVTIWVVLLPSSGVVWRAFKGLPVPPDELKEPLNYPAAH